MGLDMYLSKKYYIGHEERETLQVTGTERPIEPKNVEYIVEDVGYWRKANAIHKWFVENVQSDVDNCATYFVSEEQLRQLLNTVNQVLAASELIDGPVHNGTSFQDGNATQIIESGKVIKDPTVAMELLPTENGFFFGSTDYDQWYFEDLVETKRILEEALNGDSAGADFYYQSSW